MSNSSFQALHWDDDDETQRSMRPKLRSAARVKDTLVEMDEAPPTEREPDTIDSPRYQDDESPTAAFQRLTDDDLILIEEASPASVIRPSASRALPASAPIPLVEDEFDNRATTRRPRVEEAPTSSPIALVSSVSRSLPPDPPPPPPRRQALSSHSGDPERHKRSAHMPLIAPSAELAHLRGQVSRLRFRLFVTTAIAVVANVTSLLLAILMTLPAFSRADATPPVPARGAALAGVAKAHPDFETPAIALPAVTVPVQTSAEAAAAAGKVEVVVTLLSPRASVALTRFGELPQQITGPWPVTLQLEPGKYTLTAARYGRPAVMRMLDLSLERPRREVSLKVR